MQIFRIVVLALIVVFVSCQKSKLPKLDTTIFQKTLNAKTSSLELEDKVVVLEMLHQPIFCPCAKWITTQNKRLFDKKLQLNEPVGDSLLYHILPATDTVKTPEELTDNFLNQKFRFTGSFFKEMQYLNIEGEERPAITFCYNIVELVNEN